MISRASLIRILIQSLLASAVLTALFVGMIVRLDMAPPGFSELVVVGLVAFGLGAMFLAIGMILVHVIRSHLPLGFQRIAILAGTAAVMTAAFVLLDIFYPVRRFIAFMWLQIKQDAVWIAIVITLLSLVIIPVGYALLKWIKDGFSAQPR
jgi:hypothetical protein